jgi:hypothetical protein
MNSRYLILDEIIRQKTEKLLPIQVMSKIKVQNLIRECATEFHDRMKREKL